MKHYVCRLAVALLTFTIGGLSTKLQAPTQQKAEPQIVQDAKAVSHKQSKATNQETQVMYGGRVKLVSLSPYKLQEIISKNKFEWNKNRRVEEIDLSDVWNELEMRPEVFRMCEGDCEAKLYQTNLDATAGKEIILKLTKSFDFCRYLLFKTVSHEVAKQGKWAFLGYIDHDFNRYEMSTFRIVNAGSKHWLIVRGQVGSGTGFSFYENTWYEVNDSGVREVLSHPVSGHEAPWPQGVGSEIKSSFSSSQPSKEPIVVTIWFQINFRRSKLRGIAD